MSASCCMWSALESLHGVLAKTEPEAYSSRKLELLRCIFTYLLPRRASGKMCSFSLWECLMRVSAPFGRAHAALPALRWFMYSTRKTRSPLSNLCLCGRCQSPSRENKKHSVSLVLAANATARTQRGPTPFYKWPMTPSASLSDGAVVLWCPVCVLDSVFLDGSSPPLSIKCKYWVMTMNGKNV